MRLSSVRFFSFRQNNSEILDFPEKGTLMDAEFPGRADAIPLIPAQGIGQENGFHIFKCKEIRIAGHIRPESVTDRLG